LIAQGSIFIRAHNKREKFTCQVISKDFLNCNFIIGDDKNPIIPKEGITLFDLFKSDVFYQTYLSKEKWINLIPNSKLQKNCNKQGFNNKVVSEQKVRIGIIGNQENDCNSPDSRLGIGGYGKFGGVDSSNSVGNEAKHNGKDNRGIKTFG